VLPGRIVCTSTCGLVVEYVPATDETRVRFSASAWVCIFALLFLRLGCWLKSTQFLGCFGKAMFILGTAGKIYSTHTILMPTRDAMRPVIWNKSCTAISSKESDIRQRVRTARRHPVSLQGKAPGRSRLDLEKRCTARSSWLLF
jgi:hypothetical protein